MDYCLRKRFYTMAKSKTQTPQQKKKHLQLDAEMTKLHSLEIDLTEPLSSLDWSNCVKVVKDLEAFCWMQVLPANYKSSNPF